LGGEVSSEIVNGGKRPALLSNAMAQRHGKGGDKTFSNVGGKAGRVKKMNAGSAEAEEVIIVTKKLKIMCYMKCAGCIEDLCIEYCVSCTVRSIKRRCNDPRYWHLDHVDVLLLFKLTCGDSQGYCTNYANAKLFFKLMHRYS
jgi:hypothetical protein